MKPLFIRRTPVLFTTPDHLPAMRRIMGHGPADPALRGARALGLAFIIAGVEIILIIFLAYLQS